MGTVGSGIVGHVRGWDVGARVVVWVDENGEDVCQVWITGGSNNHEGVKYLGEFKAEKRD